MQSIQKRWSWYAAEAVKILLDLFKIVRFFHDIIFDNGKRCPLVASNHRGTDICK